MACNDIHAEFHENQLIDLKIISATETCGNDSTINDLFLIVQGK
jgi:hypothetical protein